MARVDPAAPTPSPPLPTPLLPKLLALPLILVLLLAAAAAQDPAPPPPPPPSAPLAPVGETLPQYPSYVGVAAEIRRYLFGPPASLEQLGISVHNDSSVTVRGVRYQLDETGGVTVGHERLQVRADGAVSVNGVWHYPAPPEEDQRRRKPPLEQLPPYDGGPVRSIRLDTMLTVAVPAAATMLLLLLCCLACTHRSCWCCGICDGRINAADFRKMFSDKGIDKQPLIIA